MGNKRNMAPRSKKKFRGNQFTLGNGGSTEVENGSNSRPKLYPCQEVRGSTSSTTIAGSTP